MLTLLPHHGFPTSAFLCLISTIKPNLSTAASMAAPARVPRSFVLLAELEKGEKGLGAGLLLPTALLPN